MSDTATHSTRSPDWKLIREWSAVLFGLVGAVLGCLGYLRSSVNARAAQDLEVARLTSDAWDLLGGSKGVKTISIPAEMNLASARDYEFAKRKIDEALRLDRRSVRGLTLLGVYWLARGDLAQAEEAAREALTVDSQDPNALIAFGAIQVERGDHRLGREYVLQALAADASHPGALYNLAMDSWWEGHVDEARGYFSAAVDSDPVDKDLFSSYARFEAEQENYEAAIELLVKAAKLEPAETDLLSDLGLYLYLTDETEAAVDVLWRAVESDPMDARSHERMANCLRKLGVEEEAKKYFEVADSIRSSRPYQQLAWVRPQNTAAAAVPAPPQGGSASR